MLILFTKTFFLWRENVRFFESMNQKKHMGLRFYGRLRGVRVITI